MADRTALIVGAGIGGLAAAVALVRAGWRVRVFERAATARELGFALGLAPNARAALEELGLWAALTPFAVPIRRADVRALDGRVRRRLDLANARGAEGVNVLHVALRPAVHGVLLRALADEDPAALELGCEITAVAATAASAEVIFADGTRARGDAVIGADGVGSMVRRWLHPDESPPRPSGYLAIRGVAPDGVRQLGACDGVGYLDVGVEGGTVRAGVTEVYWYLSLLTADVGPSRDPRQLVEALRVRCDPAFRALMAETPAADLRLDELFSRTPLPTWGHGRVTLLGDAAHPVLPHSGQGAAQALEDAVALGLVLGNVSGSPEPALRRYEAVRRARTTGIERYGRRVARLTTTRNPVIGGLRNALISLTPVALLGAAYQLRRPSDPHRALR